MAVIGTAIILIRGQSVLLQHRDNKPDISYPDHWALPGGACESGEAPEAAMIREIEEETSYKASPKPLTTIQPKPDCAIYVFVDRYDERQSISCREGQEFRFVDLDEMRQLLLVPPTLELCQRALMEGQSGR